MKQIIIYYNPITETVKTKSKNDLQWYDPIKKEIQYFSGGKLEFEYRECDYLKEKGYHKTFRLLPKVIDIEIKKTHIKSDKNKINDFIAQYINYNNSDIAIDDNNTNNIVLNIPDKEIDDLSFELDNNNFEHEIL